MMRRLLITLLAVAFTGCGAEHHAQSVLAAYKAAVTNNDIPAYVRLAEPNMRALIEREELRKDATVKFIDTITTRPQRVVRTAQGVAYLGWVREQCGTCEWNLMAVVVGEGRAISKHAQLRSVAVNETTEWQVSALAGHETWRLAHVWKENDEAAVNTALAGIDDRLLATWYFEGSSDAQREIQRRLGTPD
jgi:hypothetical protein